LFHKGERVAVHLRGGLRGRHTTLPEHMPRAHRRHAEWTIERIRGTECVGGFDQRQFAARFAFAATIDRNIVIIAEGADSRLRPIIVPASAFTGAIENSKQCVDLAKAEQVPGSVWWYPRRESSGAHRFAP